MSDQPTTHEVFVQAVKDHLDGTPYKHHPVQFDFLKDIFFRCTLCKSVVSDSDREGHRKWHDLHMREHDRIMRVAQEYTPPPRFG